MEAGRRGRGAPEGRRRASAHTLTLPLITLTALITSAAPLWLSASLSACGEPTHSPAATHSPATTHSPAATHSPAPPARCARDEDCVGAWWPGADECASVARCDGEVCAPPPGISGDEGATQATRLTLSWGADPPPPLTHPRAEVWAEWVASDFELSRGLMCRAEGAPGWVMALLFPRPSGGTLDPRGEWTLTSAHTPAPLLTLAFSAEGHLLGAALLTRGAERAPPPAHTAPRWRLPEGAVTALEVTPSLGEPLWGALTRELGYLLSPPPEAPDTFTELPRAALESLPQSLYPASPRAHLAR